MLVIPESGANINGYEAVKTVYLTNVVTTSSPDTLQAQGKTIMNGDSGPKNRKNV